MEQRLRAAIEHAAHLLPSQGPLSVFVHHNTLHAFEHLPFAEAMRQAKPLLGCEPYLSEQRYHAELAAGRMLPEDLAQVLHEDLGDRADHLVGLLGTRYALRLAMLQTTLESAPPAELRWVLAETDALGKFRTDVSAEQRQRMIIATRRWVMRSLQSGVGGAGEGQGTGPVASAARELLRHWSAAELEEWEDSDWEQLTLELLWRLCGAGAALTPTHDATPTLSERHRELLLATTGRDSDELVHDLLIRFSAAFLDQGLATWGLEDRDEGYLASFLQLCCTPGLTPAWLRPFARDARRFKRTAAEPLLIVETTLVQLGVEPAEYESYLTATLLALRGWAGMVQQMETNAEWTARPAPAGTLHEFLAVRLLLDRYAVEAIAREELGDDGDLATLRERLERGTLRSNGVAAQRGFLLFQLAQALGWTPEDLTRLDPDSWRRLGMELDLFPSLERRRVLHLAYERRYREQALDALAMFSRETRHNLCSAESRPPAPDRAPLFQVICCIDEREESFRRHLEEVQPQCETFGIAGFFGVAMYYRGIGEAFAAPLCPIVVKPTHYVLEQPAEAMVETHQRRAATRKLLGVSSRHVHRGSRSLIGGAFTALFGLLASAPLVFRILLPHTSARIRRRFEQVVAPPAHTELTLERTSPEPGPDADQLGYSVAEMVNIVEGSLRNMGLVRNFAPLVLVCGHGSSSLNNPHASAYDCGACGGGRGGPNARAFAEMANDPRVRAILAERGIALPAEVWFIGSLHNTCSDDVEYYDLDRLPEPLRPQLEVLRIAVDEARRRNAHERCRRFVSAPLALTVAEALRHVEARSEDLAQLRPECGHATNAMCMVGRRERTRGLFLDRRAFLTSYDPTTDDDQTTILARILGAVIPVCGGINLEYYFSYVDSPTLGCGTKLPHNITSLLGVMNGAASDLRTGLPWQMVEIHEPVRILFVIETTPEKFQRILDQSAALKELVNNQWVQVATLDPHSDCLHLRCGDQFEPYTPPGIALPKAPSSSAWYSGWRDHLRFAMIQTQAVCPQVEGASA